MGVQWMTAQTALCNSIVQEDEMPSDLKKRCMLMFIKERECSGV